MPASKRNLWAALLMAVPLATMSCEGPEGTGSAPEQDRPAAEAAIVGGEAVTIRMQNDSIISGYAVAVRKRDGTKVPAIFRGPSKLAEVASHGTFEFDEDSLHVRVRLLGPEEELRRRIRQRP